MKNLLVMFVTRTVYLLFMNSFGEEGYRMSREGGSRSHKKKWNADYSDFHDKDGFVRTLMKLVGLIKKDFSFRVTNHNFGGSESINHLVQNGD
jgi:hypothetical protein